MKDLRYTVGVNLRIKSHVIISRYVLGTRYQQNILPYLNPTHTHFDPHLQLFIRLAKLGYPVCLLKTQYRCAVIYMYTKICTFVIIIFVDVITGVIPISQAYQIGCFTAENSRYICAVRCDGCYGNAIFKYQDGISASDRSPVLPNCAAVCFLDVGNGQVSMRVRRLIMQQRLGLVCYNCSAGTSRTFRWLFKSSRGICD